MIVSHAEQEVVLSVVSQAVLSVVWQVVLSETRRGAIVEMKGNNIKEVGRVVVSEVLKLPRRLRLNA